MPNLEDDLEEERQIIEAEGDDPDFEDTSGVTNSGDR